MSKILDVTKYTKLPLDTSITLALDTNVLLWTFYSRSSQTKSYQKNSYPNFITNAISSGNQLVVTAFNLNEMFHVIEKNECELYNKANGLNTNVKRFRSIANEREKVKKEIHLIYKQLLSIPNIKIVGSIADISNLKTFTNEYDVHNCDFFDFCLIDYCNKNKLCIVTDDCDFKNPFNSSTIYTANPKVI